MVRGMVLFIRELETFIRLQGLDPADLTLKFDFNNNAAGLAFEQALKMDFLKDGAITINDVRRPPPNEFEVMGIKCRIGCPLYDEQK